MLRVSEFKKSSIYLGDPVGREVCIKHHDRKSLSPIYVKYGRDLAKVTNLSKDWNVTMFDSGLNQPVLPWIVIPGTSDKRIVSNTNEKGLKVFGDQESSGTTVQGGDSTKTEELFQPDSAVHLMSANGKIFAMTLDDDYLVQNFELLNGKLVEKDYPEIAIMGGKIIPVIKSSGDTEYLAHCSEKKLTLYNLIKSDGGKSERSIKMSTICQKLFYTENKKVLLISENGLHVFSLDGNKISPSYYCFHFSKDWGWNKSFYDTIQLVKLANEEVLISTGPNGIQVVKISEECKVYTIQDDPDKIKHVSIGNAIGKGSNQIEVIGYYNTEMHSFTLTLAESQAIPEPTVEEPQQPPQPTAPKLNPKFKLSNNFAKPIRWLLDTLDESHFRNTVNKLTGRVELAFPLVDLQDRFGVPFKLMAHYQEGLGEQMGVLGRHWTLGRDCIVLDDKGSVFGEVHEYFLVKDQVRIKLVKREVRGDVLRFEVEGRRELSVEYRKKEEKWMASNGEVTYIYGDKDKGAVLVPAFENWYGAAAKYERNKIDHAVQWNLIEISRNVDNNVKIELSYEAQEGSSYVKHLRTIQDNLGAKIILKYSKNIDNHNNPYMSDSEKKVKGHNFDNNKLLTNIEIETPSYTQKLVVNIIKIDQSYYLHEISQQAEGETQIVIKFEYTDQPSDVKLNRIQLPSGNKLKYEYKNETIASAQFQQNIGKLMDFFTGPGYSLQIALQNGDKTLNIDLKDNAGFNNFVKKHQLEINEVKRIVSYKPILQQNYLAIIVDIKEDKNEDEQILSKIYLFDKDDGQIWKQYKEKQFEYKHLKGDDFRIEFQENLVMYFDSAKINFISWNAEGKNWKHSERNIENLVAVSFLKNGAVYYSDNFYLIRINEDNTVFGPTKISTTSETPNMKSWESFFEHIDIQAVDNSSKESTKKDIETYRKQFARLINDSSMVMYNNLLIARTIELTPSCKIALKLYLYLLNKEYAVVQSQILDIPGEDLSKKEFKFDALDEYRSAKVDVNDLEQYTFKFVKEKGKFKLKFQLSKQISTGKKVEPSTKQMTKIEIMQRMMKIPMDFERYILQVNSDGVICGNQLIYHDGSTFKTSPLDEKSLKLEQFQLPVGDYSVLKKKIVTDNLKFCTKVDAAKEDCSNLETSSARNVSIKYPHYFISQSKENTWVHVLKPNGNGVREKVSFPKEMVHSSSSHSTFVATKLADNSTHVRPFRSISNSNAIQVEVVSKESLKTANGEYSISYEYQNPVLSNTQVLFRTTLVIPGSNKAAFGFYQESVDFITNEQVVQVMDSEGKLFDPEYLKRMNEVQEEQQMKRDKPEVDSKQIVMDKSGTLPILITKPYVGDDRAMINFFSFEDYESGEGWTYDNKDVIRDGFSATGRNYLNLSRGQSIAKNFSQLRFVDHFVLSTWIRTTKSLNIGEPTDMVTLELKTPQKSTVQGIIKQQTDDWLYIEANTSSLKRPPGLNPKIDLTVKIASTDAELHVDHVRFTPLNFNFEARVYDSRTSQRIATIHNNGRVSRFVHDDYSRRIAEIDELGGIKYFATYSVEEGSNSRLQIRPKVGFMESFSPYTVGGHWQTTKDQKVEPGKIRLNGELIYSAKLASDALSVRMMYNLLDSGSFTVRIAGRTVNISAAEIKLNNKTYQTPPKQAELIILATSSLTTVWIEGIIILEEQSAGVKSPELSIASPSEVEIRDLIVLESPQVFVSYLNHDSNPIQEIMLEDGSNILIRQLIHDEIGRKVAETIWTRIPISVLSSSNQGFLTYKNDFVTNDDLSKPTSFLKRDDGKITGLVHDHNQLYAGYPYSQIIYHPNPLEIRHKIAQPGELYSIKKGSFLHTFDISSSVPFINSNYPNSEGYRCEEERKPNGMTQVTVYNRRNRKVAEYISVRDYKNALTTYLYDEFGNQIQMLPPKFYETSRTGKMSPEKVKKDTTWATNSEYNKEGKLLMKRTTPDGGVVEFIYDDYNQLRYQLHYNKAKQVDKIVYFQYNLYGQVYETGKLNATAGLADKLRKEVNADLPDRSNVLYFDYGETDSDPATRGRTQRVIKQNGDLQFKQVLFYDEDGNVLRKSFLSKNANETLSLDYLWKNDQITGIRYPFFVKGKQLVLRYEHNLRGEVTSIGLIDNKLETSIVKLGHDALGKVTEISHQYGENKFNQSYEYAAPGYLKIIKNPFLTETLYYTQKGYGAEPVGDGSILRTEFHATWHNQCDQNLIPLTARAFISDRLNAKMAELCFDALLERGYFDGQGRPLKSYYPDLEVDMPIKCSTGLAWENIATGILEHGYPEHYGHAYDYGSLSELVAAKYFVGNEREHLELPWKAKNFEDQMKSELYGAGGTINLTQVWNELNEAKIYNRVQGVKALFTDSNSKLDPNSIENVAYRYYLAKLVELNTKAIPEICRNFFANINKNKSKEDCSNTLESFKQSIVNPKLFKILDKYPKIKKNIITRLWKNLASTLGNSPADVESFSIDSNGNHGTYYTGFKRFELIYKSTNNQIATIKKGSKSFEIVHDSEGNIIKATHKGIDKLEYDPLTQRVSKIEMSSKKLIIEFGYDHLGERVMKRVRSSTGDVLSELYYVRDSNGNTLVEYKLTYPNPKETSKPIVSVTAYIHGPLGLVGFFRNDKYYSVLLDHERSTRLVVHQNRVEAAYDYMPYGQLMRKFGVSSEAHIAYRYTGQEYDEETGLYNYHARLYDPDIGRFYQLDPMEQYPSPYKYAGNSPVSQIDPDGQVAITLIIIGIGALLGAYFGAASANNSWNPAEWDWANKRTWIGLFAGALAGGFAAYGGLASFAYLTSLFGGSLVAAGVVTGTLAAGGAFLGAAAATNEWNPRKWDWTSPIVWNGLLTGTAVAVSLPSGFVGISRTFYSLVSNAAKILYGSAMISGFLLLGYVGGAFANNFIFRIDQWDWRNPRTWFGIIEGSATVIMATGGTVKHGAFKTHFITSPGKLKVAWYRINIPAQSFTIKETPWKFFITYYKNGQKVGSQIVDITTRKGLRSVPQVWQGTTQYFFISTGRIAAGMVAVGAYTFAKYHNYRSLFQQYPNETQKIGVKEQFSRSKRYALDSEHNASNSASRVSFFGDILQYVMKFFTQGDILKESIWNRSVEPILPNFHAKSESTQQFSQKLCYSAKDHKNHFICPQRESTVNVYIKSETFFAETFGQDSFKNCFPITWQGYPSVSCDGQQSTFVYTPRQQLRVFDMVEGWLLLARVAPAALRSFKNGFNFVKSVFSGRVESDYQPEDHQKKLRIKLNNLKRIIQNREGITATWAIRLLEYLEEDITDYERLKKGSKYQSDLLDDRLDALREDVLEDISFAHSIYMCNVLKNISNSQKPILSALTNDMIEKSMTSLAIPTRLE